MGEPHATGWRVGRHRLVADHTFGVSAAVLRESRRRAEAGALRSKLRTSRHARATSSAAAGTRAASAINADLVADDVKRAQAARRAARRRTTSKRQHDTRQRMITP
jgi:hypothetical protein